MDARQKQEKLAACHRAVKYDFILTELELALTFCEMAMASDNQAKSARNTENAQRAYDSATHFLQEEGVQANVWRKLVKLEAQLKTLSERAILRAPAEPG